MVEDGRHGGYGCRRGGRGGYNQQRGRGRGYRNHGRGRGGKRPRWEDDDDEKDPRHDDDDVRGNSRLNKSPMVDSHMRADVQTKTGSHVGSLPRHLNQWHTITRDPFIIDIVKNGMPIEFIETPVQKSAPQTHVNQSEVVHIDAQIDKLLKQGVISKCTKVPGEFISRIFTRQKKSSNERRLIINLKPIKQYIKYKKFKMDTFKFCVNLVQKQGFMAAVDLRCILHRTSQESFQKICQIYLERSKI